MKSKSIVVALAGLAAIAIANVAENVFTLKCRTRDDEEAKNVTMQTMTDTGAGSFLDKFQTKVVGLAGRTRGKISDWAFGGHIGNGGHVRPGFVTS